MMQGKNTQFLHIPLFVLYLSLFVIYVFFALILHSIPLLPLALYTMFTLTIFFDIITFHPFDSVDLPTFDLSILRFITLFQEPSAASRFVRQRVLINTDPIMKRQEELANKGKHGDIREDPFIYCYLYGIMIHKLGHFHDIVHGTRHDYFMNELRIEFMELWIELLEKHSFDPAFLESSEEFRWMLKQLTPGQTVN
mmetsp:Transcript_28784/g.37171  ORF Transcript_28784/g.37171 Transcript_28784/m.37171 type:complete len:196 (-) Transcript_28784:299-886(-)